MKAREAVVLWNSKYSRHPVDVAVAQAGREAMSRTDLRMNVNIGHRIEDAKKVNPAAEPLLATLVWLVSSHGVPFEKVHAELWKIDEYREALINQGMATNEVIEAAGDDPSRYD